jgi:hypothetical protein
VETQLQQINIISHHTSHTLHLYVCLWHIAASNATKYRAEEHFLH